MFMGQKDTTANCESSERQRHARHSTSELAGGRHVFIHQQHKGIGQRADLGKMSKAIPDCVTHITI